MPKRRITPERSTFIPIGPSIAYVPLTQGQFSLIDSWNASRVGEGLWFADKDTSTGNYYAMRRVGVDGKQVKVRLQDFILGVKGVDHIKHVTLDNRESQLRPATAQQQAFNRRYKKSMSTLKGARWHKRVGKWQATISIDRKQKHLGYFPTEKAAHDAYASAAIQSRGEFACF